MYKRQLTNMNKANVVHERSSRYAIYTFVAATPPCTQMAGSNPATECGQNSTSTRAADQESKASHGRALPNTRTNHEFVFR